MPDAAADWGGARRRRWSASRVAAALALHAGVLVALKLAVDRVEMPARGADRATTLVTVVLHAAPPPPLHDLPLPKPARTPTPLPARTLAPASRAPDAPVPPREPEPQATAPPVAAATPPASAPPDLGFLDNAATRQAIRDAARGSTLASAGNAITSTGQTAGERLAKGVDAAHKGDCMKGDYLGGGMGLLSTPFLLAAEAMGKCSHNN
jgi:hypothetical protein